MLKALEDGEITKGSVIVIRYEGPKGGPGMPEMCMSLTIVNSIDYIRRLLRSDMHVCDLWCWVGQGCGDVDGWSFLRWFSRYAFYFLSRDPIVAFV